jgi:hypothetical protein
MLPAETFDMRKRLLTFSLAQNAEEIFKTYKVFISGDILVYDIISSFYKNVQNIATH